MVPTASIVSFGRCEPRIKEFGILITWPLTNFKKQLISWLNISALGEKITSSCSWNGSDILLHDEQTHSVYWQPTSLSKGRTGRKESSEAESLAATELLCGRQEIALRGYRNDGLDVPNKTSTRHGNFQALLRFCIYAGNEILEHHLEAAGLNEIYQQRNSK